MPVSASIYTNLEPEVKIESPIERQAKAATLKQLMGQNQLQDLQRQKLEGDLGEETAGREYLKNLAPGTDPLSDESISGLTRIAPTRGIALQKTALENRKTQQDLRNAQLEEHAKKAAQFRDAVASAPDSQTLAAEAQRIFGRDVASTIQIPDQITPEWRQQQVTTGAEYLKQLEAQKTRDVTLRGQDITVRGQDMTDSRTRSEGAANRGVTLRGQNMTDKRTRELGGLGEDGNLSPTVETTAQAIASGNLAPLSGFALAKPMGQQIMARVMQINPGYSAKDFATGAKAEKDFATGKQGQAVKSFNVSIAHLETLDQLSDALKNGNMQVVNKIGNEFAKQTGQAAPTNFEAAKKIVADEIVKAIVGSGGGVADREEAARTISAASSPAQLKGVISTYKELMKGQLHGLRQQYETSTGRKDFDRFLSDSAKQTDAAPGGQWSVVK